MVIDFACCFFSGDIPLPALKSVALTEQLVGESVCLTDDAKIVSVGGFVNP